MSRAARQTTAGKQKERRMYRRFLEYRARYAALKMEQAQADIARWADAKALAESELAMAQRGAG